MSFSLGELGTLLSYGVIRSIARRRDENLDCYLLDTSLEREGDISFSVRNEVEDIVAASESCSRYCDEHGVDERTCMRVRRAIEELLTFLVGNCLDADQMKYIDVRICKLGEDVSVRFRYVSKVFDPVTFYAENGESQEIREELLGLKMIFTSARTVDFRQVLGANNLLIAF